VQVTNELEASVGEGFVGVQMERCFEEDGIGMRGSEDGEGGVLKAFAQSFARLGDHWKAERLSEFVAGGIVLGADLQ